MDVRFIGTPQECAEASLRLRREFRQQVTRQSRQKPARQPGLVMVYLAIVLDPPGKPEGGDAPVSGLKRAPLKQRTAPLARDKELARGGQLARTPLRRVSARRAAENRERRKVVAEMFGEERPACWRPGCARLADDVHEPLTRARGGSIVDPENMAPLCRPCHDEVTFAPDSELGWAYEAGLLRHSWDGRAA